MKTNEIINTIILTMIGGIIGYIIFLYVVVHYIGGVAGDLEIIVCRGVACYAPTV